MRDACAYRIGSAATESKSGIRTTVRARSARGRRLARGTNAAGAAAAPDVSPGAQAGDSAPPPEADIAYGSTGGAGGPGVSTVVESISVQPPSTAGCAPAGRAKAVPRRSGM